MEDVFPCVGIVPVSSVKCIFYKRNYLAVAVALCLCPIHLCGMVHRLIGDFSISATTHCFLFVVVHNI
jgi:hypothetical protein